MKPTNARRNAEICDLIRSGATTTEVANKYNLTHSRISQIAHNGGIPPLERGRPPATFRDINGRVCTICLTYKSWQEFSSYSYARCRECFSRTVNYTRKLKVLEAYGGKCECPPCGETCPSFLTIDHIDSNGSAHRKQSGITGGSGLYNWLIQNEFPKDNFRLLCFNCNCGRQVNGGVCPHVDPGS